MSASLNLVGAEAELVADGLLLILLRGFIIASVLSLITAIIALVTKLV